MYFFRDRGDKVLPYGMILTRLFKNLKANMPQNSFYERYKFVPIKASSLKAKQPKSPPPKRTRNVAKSKRTQLSTSSSTESPPSDNRDLPRTKLSPRSYHRALKDDPNMSKEQKETRGMFKNLDAAHINAASKVPMLKPGEFELWRMRIEQCLPSEWGMHVVVWRNKTDLDTLSMDDLYNNLKTYEYEVKGISSSTNTQNKAFMSSSSNNSNNSNGVNTAQGVNTANGVNTASSQVNAASASNIDNPSDAVICAFLASQPNNTQLLIEDLEQIHPDDLEEIDLKWQIAMLTMRARRFLKNTGRKLNRTGNDSVAFDKTKVKCYNCQKRGHFARECQAPRGHDNRSRDVTRKTMPVETPNSSTLCMQTRSSSRLVSNPSSNPTPSTNLNPKGRNRRRLKQRIEEFNLEELSPPIVMMTDQHTMAQLLQAPTEGYEDAIVVSEITTDNFELKHGLLTLRFDESFSEAWDIFKDLLRAYPHHGFSKLHQLDTFYNALNSKYQDLLNSAAYGNFLDKMPHECLVIIDSKSKVRYSYNKPVVAKVSMNTSTFGISPDVAELKDMMKAILLDKKTYVKANDAVVRNMQTQGQNMQNQLTNLTELLTKFVNSNSASTSSSGTLPSNTIAKPRSDLKAINTRSEATKDTVHLTNNGSTENIQPSVVSTKSPILTSEPVNSPIIKPVASPVSAPRPNQRPSIPYPARLQDQKLRDKANNQREKFFQIFKDLTFNFSFADALILMPKFGPSIKSLLTNKHKLCELAKTLLNEHCSAVLLKKFPEKLGDPGKFLIPCDFPRKAECLALADLDANINLMPLSVWNKLSLPEFSPTCMTLELADHSITHPVGVAEDVYVKVGTFHFSADFVVVVFDADPRVPLILGRSFLKTGRALIDVFKEVELKELPPHLKYVFLEGDNKLPVIITKDLSMEEKTALITALKSHKRAIAWKLSDIKGECGFLLIFRNDGNLEITRETVEKTIVLIYR
nr:reverse transcriptase domain-containing protein [Tanacetum cinerariifolium]